MDPITHAASGAVALLALPRRPLTRWAVPLAALVTASPDLDILFASDPLSFLLLHRGISHSVLASPLLGLLLALCCYPLWRASTPGRWPFAGVWCLTTLLVCLHIWLDAVTTYGTMAFLPLSGQRVRLNGVFIIDFLLTLPMLWAIWRWRARRGLILLTLAWIFIYPALGVGLSQWHGQQNTARLQAEGHKVSSVTVLPDAFAPFFWRLLYAEDSPQGPRVVEQSLDALGRPRAAASSQPGLPLALQETLRRQSTVCSTFLDFSLLPVQAPLRPADAPQNVNGGNALPLQAPAPATAGRDAAPHSTEPETVSLGAHTVKTGATGTAGTTTTEAGPTATARTAGQSTNPSAGQPPLAGQQELLIYDLRFGSGLGFIKKLMALRPHADIPFQLMLQLDAQGNIIEERLRFSDSRRDSGWHKPQPPHAPSLARWLVGLR